MKTYLKTNKTPQEDQYENVSQEQPITQQNTVTNQNVSGPSM